ncbi:hypothetical protein B0H14DRAFT_2614812 [Mycena olivaceomarginata]|nr:hypothetical protein B0H14DRAFT_2614812 [Mycena olivaceomarginata]
MCHNTGALMRHDVPLFFATECVPQGKSGKVKDWCLLGGFSGDGSGSKWFLLCFKVWVGLGAVDEEVGTSGMVEDEGNFGVAEATGKWYRSLSFLGLVACVVIAASTGQIIFLVLFRDALEFLPLLSQFGTTGETTCSTGPRAPRDQARAGP